MWHRLCAERPRFYPTVVQDNSVEHEKSKASKMPMVNHQTILRHGAWLNDLKCLTAKIRDLDHVVHMSNSHPLDIH